jgi:hypothetical protein
MKRTVFGLLVVAAVADIAAALPCPGPPGPHVCTYLQPQNLPGGNKVIMTLGEIDTAVVQLMLDIPSGTTMLTFDAIINQYQGDLDTPSTDFQITGLNGMNPPGTMDFIGWGSIDDGGLPAMAHNDSLQYLADTTQLPLDMNSGTRGPITLVMGEITLQGLTENTLNGGVLRFYSPGGLGDDQGNPADLKAPGGFRLLGPTGGWRFGDVILYHSVGGDPRITNFWGVPYTSFGVNVLVPEPASMSLLALGGLALIRRRR